jgi:glycosyltransferase involved in cell wall biosynthesis
VLRLANCSARAYLVQDHEPEFFATSAEAVFAAHTYEAGLYCIAASPWLRDLLKDRYGAHGTFFELGVDHSIYHPRPGPRRRDTVIFYARDVTPRRAVPLGVLALEELHRRRPELRFVLFGDKDPLDTPFPYEHLGIASPEELSWAYSEARVGLSLSLTNYSLTPQEMLACGLPVVELAGRSIESVFGPDGPIGRAADNPVALADAIEQLLGDEALWEHRSREGIAFASERTWDRAADELEQGLRAALRFR